jgi:hypothetical protein
MSEPKRLADGAGDAFERELIVAARSETGNELALRRTVTAMTTTAVVGGSTAATAGMLAARGAGVAVGLAKWFVLGVTAGLVVVAGGQQLHPRSGAVVRGIHTTAVRASGSSPARDPENASHESTPPMPSLAISAEPKRRANALGTQSIPAAPRAPNALEVDPVSPPIASNTLEAPPPPVSDALAAEVAVLQRARAAILERRASDALGAIDDYSRAFPTGVLAMEAAVLRIEALALSGDLERARRFGEAFLVAHPDTPDATRIRSLIGGGAGR